jgi:hypothetical protein
VEATLATVMKTIGKRPVNDEQRKTKKAKKTPGGTSTAVMDTTVAGTSDGVPAPSVEFAYSEKFYTERCDS